MERGPGRRGNLEKFGTEREMMGGTHERCFSSLLGAELLREERIQREGERDDLTGC